MEGLLCMWSSRGTVLRFIGESRVACRQMLTDYGLLVFVELQWRRQIHVPSVLRVFWLSRAFFHFVYIIHSRLSFEGSVGGGLTSGGWVMSQRD